MIWQPSSPKHLQRMSPAQKAMMLAEQQAEFHTAELGRIGHDHEYAEFQARSAVDALTTLGRFDEARQIVHLAPPEYGELLEAHDAACQVDDDERCNCPNPTTPRIEGGVSFEDEENPRYLVERPAIFNPYTNRLDTVWRCHLCGHRNAIPDHPDKVTADQHDKVTQAHRNAA